MGIGLGIVLIVVGAILLWALNFDLPFLDNEALGVICMAAGVLAIILALVINAQRSRSKHTVEERRYGDDRY
jgi:formate-dependent nitrite reductase membrane component NrfD